MGYSWADVASSPLVVLARRPDKPSTTLIKQYPDAVSRKVAQQPSIVAAAALPNYSRIKQADSGSQPRHTLFLSSTTTESLPGDTCQTALPPTCRDTSTFTERRTHWHDKRLAKIALGRGSKEPNRGAVCTAGRLVRCNCPRSRSLWHSNGAHQHRKGLNAAIV